MPENTQDRKNEDVDPRPVEEDIEGHGVEEDDEEAEQNALTLTGLCV